MIKFQLFKLLFFIFLGLVATQEIIDFDVNPTGLYITYLNPFIFICNTSRPLRHCTINAPYNGIRWGLTPGKELRIDNASYVGLGLEAGYCGVHPKIPHFGMRGIWNCESYNIDGKNVRGSFLLNIATIYKKPVLEVNGEISSSPTHINVKYKEFNEGDKLTANCIISNTKPPANLAWSVGDEKLLKISNYIIMEDPPPDPPNFGQSPQNLAGCEKTYSVSQSTSHVVRWSDHGKKLRCEAQHFSLFGKQRLYDEVEIRLKYFSPQPKNLTIIEHQGLEVGEDFRIKIEVIANPKPNIKWHIDNIVLNEGDMTDIYFAEPVKVIDNFKFEVKLLINITSYINIIDKIITLNATNALGYQIYKIKLTLGTCDMNEQYISVITSKPMKNEIPPSDRYRRLFIISTIINILLIIAIVVTYYYYYHYNKQQKPEPKVSVPLNSPEPAEEDIAEYEDVE